MNILHAISFHSKKLVNKIRTYPKMYFDFWYLRSKGVDTKWGYVRLEGLPIISKTKGSTISIGKGATLVSRSKNNLAGINHPVIIATLTESAYIFIGRCGISGSSICAAISITMGNDSGLGANSNIYDTDFHPIDAEVRRHNNNVKNALAKAVTIGENVWVASNCTILKGVSIGDNAIVGACSVVTKNVFADTMVAGNPAKEIRKLFKENT